MRRSARRLLSDIDGAVAPTIALSLVGLIAAGGVAFDYTRMASMETELQTAADQAALAAASQLDGNGGACSRAANAAVSMLASCSPGLVVVNIDNGFGAAAHAAKIIRAVHR